MMHVRFAPPLRNVEDLLNERGIDISHGLGWLEQRLKCSAAWNSMQALPRPFETSPASAIIRAAVAWLVATVRLAALPELYALIGTLHPITLRHTLYRENLPPNASATSCKASSARCAYRFVVSAEVCPSSLPMTSRLNPDDTKCDAKVCRLSCNR
jgi:DNA-binding transcriptional LysR family regulator